MKSPAIIYLLTLAFNGWGQVRGIVKDAQGDGIPGITVILEPSGKGVSTDGSGRYHIQDMDDGQYSLVVSGVGFETKRIHLHYTGAEIEQDVTLKENTTELAAVQIVARGELGEVRTSPYSVQAIDVKPLKIQNLDVNQVLNTTAGVRIRQDGGLGSNFNFSLNGFSGGQVKFFIDGLPMDNFGSSLSLNNIPINMVSGIEVYKGVVPVRLGLDALGGAVNVITNQAMTNYLDLSYSIGSFNTHRASLISRFTRKRTGFTTSLNAFFNYSDNDYQVDVRVPDPETGKVGQAKSLRRFHDGYQSQTIQIETGFVNKPFADKILLGLVTSGNNKEIQTGINMTQVSGQIYTTDNVVIPTLKYQKNDLFLPGLNAHLYATYNLRESLVADTSSRQYDWHGNYTLKTYGRSGELSWDKTLFRFNDELALATANLSYEWNEVHSFSLNNYYSRMTRIGEDPISYNPVPFSKPNTLSKNVLGAAYNLHLLKGKWKSSLFTKAFRMDAVARESEGEDDLSTVRASHSLSGYGIATTYFIVPWAQLKLSYENTCRLPEGHEMFGDGLLLEANPHLGPEKSRNLNMGFLVDRVKGKHRILAEGNYLYRTPENLIRLAAEAVTSHYENLLSARTNSFEAGFKYQFDRLLTIEINGTYQDIINTNKYEPGGGVSAVYLDRLPNMPFLFGNALVGLQFKDVGWQASHLAFNWTTQYVEAFYLKWPSQGYESEKKDIPRQLSHSVSLSYSLDDGRYTASLGCSNVTDAKLFDNFMLQKPGRAFSLKLRYFISN